MTPNVRTPRSVYVTLAGGFVLGAVCMAAFSGSQAAKAYADQSTFKPRLMASTSTESLNELRNLDTSYVNLAKFVAPAVVDIQSVTKRAMGNNGERMPVTSGEGSGFIYRPDGYIVTNDHVVGNSDTVTVTLKDGRQFEGKVTKANDANSDIAIIKVNASDLPTLAFANSAQAEPGQQVMAVGAPFGLENTVTVGHLSALGRSNQIGNRVYTDLLQTDAAINMGNSGGPLVNIEGQVIGINTAIYSPTGGSNGIGFAIPSNQAKLIADLLISKGKLTRSMMGIIPDDLKEYQRAEKKLPVGGAVVKDVVGDPAQSAGLHKDDIILKVGSTTIHGQNDLRNAMLEYAPGTSVDVVYVRNGKQMTTKVKLLAYKLPRQATQQLVPRNGRSFDFGGPGEQIPGFPNMPQFSIPRSQDDTDQDVPALRGDKVQLGVEVGALTDEARTEFSIPKSVTGAIVGSVVPGSVASRLGLRPGDVITQIGGKKISVPTDVVDAIKGVKWGDKRSIKYQRYGNGTTMIIEQDVTFR